MDFRDQFAQAIGEKLIVRNVADTIREKNLTEQKGKFASRNDMGPTGKTNGRIILNSYYPNIKQRMDEIKYSDNTLDAYYQYITTISPQASKTISDFESLMEF